VEFVWMVLIVPVKQKANGFNGINFERLDHWFR
jgi:hypothetical protein